MVFIVLSPWTLMGVFMCLSFLSLQEYWKMIDPERSPIPLWLTLYIVVLVYFPLWNAYPILQRVLWYGFFLSLMLWSMNDLTKVLQRSGAYLWGSLYCVFFPSFWVRVGVEYSRWTLLFFALLVWTNDIMAYLIGKKWGYHKIVPSLSPQKSWEGFWGGFVATVICSLVLGCLWMRFSPMKSLASGLLLAPLAFIGDLFESALKRQAGIKDSGKFLPGHGGLLDRFDAFFAVGPLVYLLNHL